MEQHGVCACTHWGKRVLLVKQTRLTVTRLQKCLPFSSAMRTDAAGVLCIFLNMYVCIYTCVCIYTHIHICVCICIAIYMLYTALYVYV